MIKYIDLLQCFRLKGHFVIGKNYNIGQKNFFWLTFLPMSRVFFH